MTAPPTLYPRYIRPRVEVALADTPVVLLAGPRLWAAPLSSLWSRETAGRRA